VTHERALALVVGHGPAASDLFRWAESTRALWRNRARLRVEPRLRLAVPVVYTAVAIGDPLLGLRERLGGGGLAFVYAKRATKAEQRG
jgi:hypothetical protein